MYAIYVLFNCYYFNYVYDHVSAEDFLRVLYFMSF